MGKKADDDYTPEQRATIKKMAGSYTPEQRAALKKVTTADELDEGRKTLNRHMDIRDGLIPPPWAEQPKPASEPEPAPEPEPMAEPPPEPQPEPEPEPASEAEPKPKRARKGKRMSRVRPVVCELYPPDGIAPDHVKTWQALLAVKKVVPDASRDTVERAIGRRKD